MAWCAPMLDAFHQKSSFATSNNMSPSVGYAPLLMTSSSYTGNDSHSHSDDMAAGWAARKRDWWWWSWWLEICGRNDAVLTAGSGRLLLIVSSVRAVKSALTSKSSLSCSAQSAGSWRRSTALRSLRSAGVIPLSTCTPRGGAFVIVSPPSSLWSGPAATSCKSDVRSAQPMSSLLPASQLLLWDAVVTPGRQGARLIGDHCPLPPFFACASRSLNDWSMVRCSRSRLPVPPL